jgi:tetratricopeptide (TPR) repeat protein
MGAELLLALKRHDEARQLYNAVIAAKAIPWARLGVARVQLAQGDAALARRTLESLLGELPQYADGYDVMGKVQMEQGQLSDALATYRLAATITPGCVLRLQHCGTLSFYAGEAATATDMLERTWALGGKSRLFDVLSMMLLAWLRFDAGDGKGLGQSCEVLNHFAQKHPHSVRLRRMARSGAILAGLHEGRIGHSVQLARDGVPEIGQPDFDMEAATNVLSLWSRLGRFGVAEHEYATVIRRVARRFSVSKAATEVLIAAVRHQKAPMGWIREAQTEILKLAEDAMHHAVAGQPRAAVETLLLQGKDTGNAKLIEMAGLVARRHQERIADVDALFAEAAALAHRYGASSTHIAGVRRSNRSAGGLILRR